MKRKAFIEECLGNNMTYAAIGGLLNISRQRVHQIATGYKSPSHRYISPQEKTNDQKMLDLLEAKYGPNPIKEGGRDRVREFVRMRDERTCQICRFQWRPGMRRLDVHHKDEELEMITLCHRCHFNLDREMKQKGLVVGKLNPGPKRFHPRGQNVSFTRSIKQFIIDKRSQK